MPPSEHPSSASETASAARSTGIVSFAILCSRLLGLVRDQLLNGLFGSAFAGIFSRAFATPNMLRDLFAEGALSTAFVTTFSKKIKLEGDESAWRLGRKMLTLSACAMSVIAVIGVLLAPFIIRLLVPGWSEPSKELTTWLAQVMYPFIILVSLTALVMGMLNAKKKFFVPAVASAFFNLGCIIGGLSLAYVLDPGFREGRITQRGLTGFAIGTLIGGVLQLVVQLPSLRGVGFRFRPDFQWKDEGVREVLRLMWPSLIAASGTQVNVLLNSIFASFTPFKESAQAWLSNAQRLQQLPLGLFGVAVATVTLPALSRVAAGGLTPAFRETLAKGLRLVLFLTLPCAVGLSILAAPIISVIFEHGKFTAFDVTQCAAALEAYAFGLIFYAGIKVVQPAFYAIDRRFFPMCVGLGVIAFNVALNSITVFVLHWGHAALAWATAAGLMLNFSSLYLAMRKFAGGLESARLGRTLARLAVAVAALALICAAARYWLFAGWEHYRFLSRLGLLGATVGLAACTYFYLTARLGVEEACEFRSLLERRLGRK
jgi:putative peptidoglycan lipid II flippase